MNYFDSEYTRGITAFPNELSHPKVKEDKIKWGLPLAQAIWTAYQQSGYKALFGDSVTYHTYVSYAFGMQDKSKYNHKTDGDPKDPFHQFVPKIKDDIKNYATKRIRIVIEKLENMQYDPIVNVTDSAAIDRKKDYEVKLKMAMENRQFFNELSEMTGMNQFPEGVNPEQIPLDENDLQIDIELNYKDDAAMEIESGCTYHLTANDFDSIKSDIDFDLAVVGGAVLYVGMDENQRPEIKRIRPDMAIVPSSNDPYHRDIPFGGYIEYMSVSDWRKHHGGEFDKQTEHNIIQAHSQKPATPYGNSQSTEVRDNDVNNMAIMYFEYKTTNEDVFLEYTDERGNERFIEKDYNYYKSEGRQEAFKSKYGNKRKLHRAKHTRIYCGYWIIGSPYIYRYGPKEHTVYHKQGGRLGEPNLGIIVITPGVRDHYHASMMKQMIPTLDDLHYTNQKIQETLANPFPGGVTIDMFALRKTNFTLGNKKLGKEDLTKLAFKNKVFLIDTEGGNYAPGSNYQAVVEHTAGLGIAEQLQILQQHLIELDEIIGYNQVTSGSPQLSERTPVRVAQMQQQTTNDALGYLFKADKWMFTRLCRLLSGLHIQSIKYNREYYANIFGEHSVKFLMSDDFDWDNVDYGLNVEPRPTQYEWENFYLELEELKKNGKLEASDVIAVKRFTNLKKAQAYMAVLEKRRAQEEKQFALQQERERSEDVMQQNQQKAELAIQEEEAKANTERIKIDGQIKLKKLEHKLLMAEIEKREALTGVTKVQVADQNNEAKIAQEVIRQLMQSSNQSDKDVA